MLAGLEQKRQTIADGRAKNKPWPMLMKNNRIAADRTDGAGKGPTTRWPLLAGLPITVSFMLFYGDITFRSFLTKT